ncbi:MAG TPA: hypothetical protein PLT91_01280 [Clostridia bacterium]|nr:MAG: hypothetical protein BWX97_00656 [Firmicutes bacterium ADurb.Bin146]HOD92498.1 hypothetical protein [Clostridia bacterium]HQM38855.1 hypothetical protein [Clostridia bacterium]
MEEKKNKKILIWLILGSAVLGIIFSILYLGFEIFIPAASAVCLCLMFLFIILAAKKYMELFSKRQMMVIKIIAWIGMISGLLAAIIQLVLFFKF